MKIVVLGATGQIGGNLTRVLCDAGHDVTALCRSGNSDRLFDLKKNADQKIDIVISENPTSKLSEHAQNADWVVDAAAPYPLELFVSAAAYQAAESRTRKIVSDCLEANAGLLYISSFVTLKAKQKSEPMGWLQRLKRRSSPYFVLKARLETIVNKQKNLKRIIVNPGAVLGPYDYKTSEQSFIGALLANAIPLAHETTVNIIDARDLAINLEKLMSAGHSFGPEVIAGHTVKISELIAMVQSLADIDAPETYALPDPLMNLGAAALEAAATATEVKMPAPALLIWLMTEWSHSELRASAVPLRPLLDTLKDCIAERRALTR